MNTIQSLFEIARPRQWIKNCFIFAPLIFVKQVSNLVALEYTFLAFIFFCLFSSCVYMINDIADLERDRLHPQKRNRPLPSGRLSVKIVLITCAVIFLVSIVGSAMLSWRFTCVGMIYLLVHLFYSFGGKSIVILDGMMVASGFVLRTYAGAVVINVEFSDWLYICALFVSLFLAYSKRRHEIILLGEKEAQNHREILQEYSTHLLDQIISIVTAATLVTYSLYCIDATRPSGANIINTTVDSQISNAARFESALSTSAQDHQNPDRHNTRMKYSIPFVIYGVFRYLYLVYRKEEGGNPTELLLSDRPMVLNGLLWLVVVFWALYNNT